MNLKNLSKKIKSNSVIMWLTPFLFIILDYLYRYSFGLKAYYLFKTTNLSDCKYNLSETGLKIVKNDSHFEEFSKWLNSQISDELLQEEKSLLLSNTELSSFSADIIQKLNEETRLGILKFALDNTNISLASNYLKSIPKIATIMVLYNIPKNQDVVGSQKWHRDWFNYRGINIFSCITPVDETTGMYSAIGKNFIPRYKEIPVFDIDPLADPWDRDRVDENLMNQFVKNNSISNLKGPIGSTALVDSGVVYHKGGYIKDGFRLMIEISYQLDHKPNMSRPVNIIDYLKLNNINGLSDVIDTPIKKYMVGGFKKPKSKRAIFHWLERNLSNYALKR